MGEPSCGWESGLLCAVAASVSVSVSVSLGAFALARITRFLASLDSLAFVRSLLICIRTPKGLRRQAGRRIVLSQ
jgi:hypothetical protein